MSVTIACVDAVTDRFFGGNPAGVCLLEAGQTEMNLCGHATQYINDTAVV